MANCPREYISESSMGKQPPPVNTSYLVPKIIGLPPAPTNPWKQTYKPAPKPPVKVKTGVKKFITLPSDEYGPPGIVAFKFGSLP